MLDDQPPAFMASDGEIVATSEKVTLYEASALLPLDYYEHIKFVRIDLGEGRVLSFRVGSFPMGPVEPTHPAIYFSRG